MPRGALSVILVASIFFCTYSPVEGMGKKEEGREKVPSVAEEEEAPLSGESGTEDVAHRGEYVPGEVLLKFKDDVSHERMDEILRLYRLEPIKFLRKVPVYQLKIAGDESVLDMVEKLSSLPEVEYAEPNYIMRLPPHEKPIKMIPPKGEKQ